MRNKRKNLFSKWMALCLTLIMAITMALPVQAQVGAEDKYSLTVTGKESDAGAAVDVYRLIKINFDTDTQQAEEPFYEWEEPVAAWLKGNEHTNYVGENDNRVTETYTELGAADLSSLMKELQAAISSSALTLTKAVSGALTSENNYQLTSDTMDMGIYLILTTPDATGEHEGHEYAPATANIVPKYDNTKKEWNVENAEVVIKGSPSSIEKEVNDHTVAIGDVLEYTITAPVPTYPKDAVAKMFRIGDKLPKGITFEQSFEKNNLTVTAVYADGNTKPIGTSEGTNDYFTYYFEKEDCGENITDWSPDFNGVEASFILDFQYDELMKAFGTSDGGSSLKEIKVTYKATVNENAFGNDALENSAYVGQNDPYDANDYDTTTDDKEKVFTYGIEISKVDKKNTTPLSGAQFELLKDNKNTKINFVKTADGTYRLAKTDETETTTTLEVNAGGKLNLNGLATGTYYLKETKAPEGYQVLKELREIKIIDAEADTPGYDHSKQPNPGAGIIDDAGDFEGDNTNIYYVTVENSKPPIMPVTGGMGTILFTIVGVVLVAGGLTLIVTYMRRRHS